MRYVWWLAFKETQRPPPLAFTPSCCKLPQCIKDGKVGPVESKRDSMSLLKVVHEDIRLSTSVSGITPSGGCKQPCGEVYMARNWDLLPTASEQLRPPINRRVSEPFWKWVLQPCSNLQMITALTKSLTATS